jgi:cell division protein FtsL
MLESAVREAPDRKQQSLLVLQLTMAAVAEEEVAGTRIVKQLLEQAAVLAAAVVVLASLEIPHLQWAHLRVRAELQTLAVEVEPEQHAMVEFLHKIMETSELPEVREVQASLSFATYCQRPPLQHFRQRPTPVSRPQTE